MEWVGVAERANRHLVRRDGWSDTDHDNIILSGESGARQHEKLCQIPHPIGANLAPALAVLTVSVQRDRAADRVIGQNLYGDFGVKRFSLSSAQFLSFQFSLFGWRSRFSARPASRK